MKFPEDRHRILNIDERINEIEGLFDEILDEDFPLEDVDAYLDEISYLMHNKYYGPFRLQGQSYREQCKERKIRKEMGKTKYRNRQPSNIKEE